MIQRAQLTLQIIATFDMIPASRKAATWYIHKECGVWRPSTSRTLSGTRITHVRADAWVTSIGRLLKIRIENPHNIISGHDGKHYVARSLKIERVHK